MLTVGKETFGEEVSIRGLVSGVRVQSTTDVAESGREGSPP